MYDELVKALRCCGSEDQCKGCPREYGKGKCYDDICIEAADAIEELDMKLHGANAAIAGMQREIERMVIDSANSKPQWIPVTERLPEEHKFVLIRQDEDRMMVAVRIDGEWWYRYFAYDIDWWDETEQGTITHWMPLPEPPKGD